MADTGRRRAMALALFALWFAFVLFAARNHVVWRDEVRALTQALQGDDVFAMLNGIHGEGHPAVWYLLLRVAHNLVGRPEVLQGVALVVAAAAMLLLVLRSPFSLPLIALILVTRPALFEYSVMARNCGISMLLLFLLAALYERHRDRGVLLGALLGLLANCNAYSVLLVGAFLLFWFVDIMGQVSPESSQRLKTFLLNSLVAAIGIALCVATIYPPFNDAAVSQNHLAARLLARGIALPAEAFSHLVPLMPREAMEARSLWHAPYIGIMQILLSLILFGSTLGLIGRPGALLAAVASLIGYSLFSKLVYTGSYRHEALWLAFLISMYWIAGSKNAQPEWRGSVRLERFVRPTSKVGWVLFVVLLALQVPRGVEDIATIAGQRAPFSRSRDLAALVANRPDLKDAVIVADPDYFVESLPYYMTNRTYLMREHKFGNAATFTRNARLRLSLDDILQDARKLHRDTGKPVLILLHERLDPLKPETVHAEGFNWELLTTPEQVRNFQRSTRLIESFARAVSDESYDVYVVN